MPAVSIQTSYLEHVTKEYYVLNYLILNFISNPTQTVTNLRYNATTQAMYQIYLVYVLNISATAVIETMFCFFKV